MEKRTPRRKSVSAEWASILISLALTTLLLCQPVAADPTRLLADLGAEDLPLGSFPRDLTVIDGVAYFSASDLAHGEELWRSDGTAAGTRMVTDLCPGSCLAQPQGMTAVEGGLLLSAFREEIGRGIFKVDPETGAAELIAAPCGTSCNSFPFILGKVADLVFFASIDATAGRELWVTDGTRAGTRRVADLCPGACSSDPSSAAVFGERLIFSAHTPTSGRELWASDGTAQGTRLLRDICPGCDSFPAPLRTSGGLLYLRAFDRAHGLEPWVTDGTPAGTRLLADLLPGPESSSPRDLARFDGRTYLLSQECSGGHGCLWTTDGTTAGTALVPSPFAPASGLSVCEMTPLSGRLLLVASSRACLRTQGWELWSANAGLASVELLRDGFVQLAHLAVAGGRAFYRGNTTEFGPELWVSDGTVSGTRLAKDLDPGPGGGNPHNAVDLGGRLVFAAQDGLFDAELWRSDGTTQGTTLVEELWQDSSSSNPTGFLAAGSGAVFGVVTPTETVALDELYSTDGTGASLLDENLFPAGGVSSGTVAYFVSPTAGTSMAVFKSDGTAAGTIAVAPVETQPQFLTLAAGRLFYGEKSQGQRLWVTDGTPGPAQLVIDVNPRWTNGSFGPFAGRLSPPPPPPEQFPQQLTPVGDHLYFVAFADGAPKQLWITDGSSGGTRALRGFPISAPGDAIYPGELTAFGNRLLFAANQDGTGRELWLSNGTEAGTILVADLAPGTASSSPRAIRAVGQKALFFARDGNGREALWRTDGTAAGTAKLRTFEAFGGAAVVAGNRLFFTARDAASGTELWTSNGTGAGTALVRDLRPGALGAAISDLTVVGAGVVFAADDGEYGRELWVSDGTAAGTRLVEDIAPGKAASDPVGLTLASGNLYFSAVHPELGREPFVLPVHLLNAACRASGERLCLGGGRFEVTARWRNQRTGAAGRAGALPHAGDSGFFWFFDPENVELLVKVLDGSAINAHSWVFGGAVSDVEYWVTVRDLAAGEVFERRNPPGTFCGFGDTQALPSVPGSAGFAGSQRAGTNPASEPLLFHGGRFRAEVEWVDHRHGNRQGTGTPLSLSEESGAFSFFRPGNLELLVKVLDGRAVNGKFWLLYGALSDVQYTLRVTDTETGTTRTYTNPAGQLCGRADVAAF